MRRVPIPSLAGCGHSIVNLSGEFEPFPRAQLRFCDPSSLSLGTKVTPCLFVHRKPWVVAPPALPDKPWFQRRRIPRAKQMGFHHSASVVSRLIWHGCGTRTHILGFGDRYSNQLNYHRISM